MLGYRSVAQIILIIISVVIIVTYIRPTFRAMQSTQSETREYQKVLESAESYNTELQRLLNRANDFSTSELRALERYLPDTIDNIAVMRDIQIIVTNNGLELNSLSTGSGSQNDSGSGLVSGVSFSDPDSLEGSESGLGQAPAPSGPDLFSQRFTLGVTGSYDQLKTLLADFERNAYPLEIAQLSFGTAENGAFTFDMTLETYSFTNPEAEANEIEQF